MSIVVTGGAGFIGSHLVDRLVADQSDEIVVIDNLFRGKTDHLHAHRDNPQVQFHHADIRDYDTLSRLCSGADVIYHLAAQSNVMGAVTDTDFSFTTNVVGTYNLLKVAREHQIRRVVFTSSREVYGEARYLPVDEQHPIDAKNTYGASKAAGELYCQVFGTFGVEVAILRLANVYGTRDFGRVIPLWLGWAQTGRDLVVYGGDQLIDFVHVTQVVEALLRAASAKIVGQPINVGSGQGTPILTLAERILQVTGATSKLDRQPARSVEVAKFTANVDLMRTHLGLEPPTDPLFALPEIWEWWQRSH
jgi:UDP-glucose 4-epimerase